PKMPIAQRLMNSVLIESSWEVLENTPMVINHYREQALAQGYTGDSIINSVSDTLSMVGGFFVASRISAWATLGIALFLALWVGWQIRDNLTLNAINLVHHFDFIAAWQAAGGMH